jgi:hypothetical protein
MHDPATDAPTAAPIDPIRTRRRDTPRRQMRDPIAHARAPVTPHGPTHSLAAIGANLGAHMVADGVILRRLNRQALEMVGVAHILRDTRGRRAPVVEADARLAAPAGATGLNNGLCHAAACDRRIAAAVPN